MRFAGLMFNGLMVGSVFIKDNNAQPFELIERLKHPSLTLMIGENTNIGRRYSQPFKRIEPLELLKPL